ncbi:MAG: phosphodiester glycosidase family protein [Anaerolineae bacterium]|nr:phosphodiester glycosidase family protein [Anaerolineae bacterium]
MRTLLALLLSRSFLLTALFLIAFTVLLLWTKRRRQVHWRFIVLRLVLTLMIVLLSAGAIYIWFNNRPLPESGEQKLFPGITYIREVRREPQALIVDVVKIDLRTPGLRFLVTPGVEDPQNQLQARTTSQFMEEFGAQVAINGDFFWPWIARTPWMYYPHVGDWVKTIGFASSDGSIYNAGAGYNYETLFISRDNQASFVAPVGDVYNAISGDKFCLYNGVVPVDEFTSDYHLEQQPRSIIGLSEDGNTLILMVIDGRQPNYSEGATLQEAGEIALEYGAYTALNLDGGGSSTLVTQDEYGRTKILNSPIDGHIPGRERPVANHLGVFAP